MPIAALVHVCGSFVAREWRFEHAPEPFAGRGLPTKPQRQLARLAFSLGQIAAAQLIAGHKFNRAPRRHIVARQQQLSAAQGNLGNAIDAMEKTVDRIRELQGDPLELIQSLEAMAQSRDDYLTAVIDQNIAQLKMLQALGESGGQ